MTRANLPRLASDEALCRVSLQAAGVALRALEDTPVEEGCGVTEAVRVNATTLSWNRGFPLTCAAAAALTVWEKEVLQPAAQSHFSQPVLGAEHFGSYACRNRNSQAAGRRSEHARANALDVAAFRLADGTRLTVKEDWRGGSKRAAFLREIHSGACDIFQVVIGPDGDSYHQDHFHFDMGRWKSCS